MYLGMTDSIPSQSNSLKINRFSVLYRDLGNIFLG